MHAKRTMAMALAIVATLALTACSDGGPDRGTPKPQTSAASPTSAPSPTAPPTTRVEPDTFHAGDPITAAEATASIPAARDGRRLSVVAGFGDEVLVDAEKDVPYLPGEVVGQGRKAADQLFMFWNPETGVFRDAWMNQSKRIETVFDIDGDWALSLLYTINPGVDWILRLRNLQTGEVRDIDQESDDRARAGLEMARDPRIDEGRVAYTRLSGLSMSRTSEVVIYDIASHGLQTLFTAEFGLETMSQGSVIGPTSISGSLVAWSQQGDLPSLIQNHVYDLETDRVTGYSDTSFGRCALVDDADWLICDDVGALRGPAGGATRTIAVSLMNAAQQVLSDRAMPGYHTWNGFVQSLPSMNGDPAMLHNLRTGESRPLGDRNAGYTARLVDGWFAWISWVDDSNGRHDWSKSTLHVVPLR